MHLEFIFDIQSTSLFSTHSIKNSAITIYLVEIEDQIEFTNVMEIFIEHLNEIMDCLQIIQIIVGNVNANAEIQSRITSINNFEVSKLEMKTLHKFMIMKTKNLLRRNSYALRLEPLRRHELLQSVFAFHHRQNACTISLTEFYRHDFESK